MQEAEHDTGPGDSFYKNADPTPMAPIPVPGSNGNVAAVAYAVETTLAETQYSISSNLLEPLLPVLGGIRTIAPFVVGRDKILPKSSLSVIESTVYIQECEAAAVASRLPPNHMSTLEASIMREHLSHLQLTTYVVTRNAILRLWVKNPMLWVSIEEAQGVAREERHFLLCRQIWEFLVRNGFINFGCLRVPERMSRSLKKRQILVIGAGIAGLSAARQIQTLLAVFQDQTEFDYQVTVVEGRSRIGGRVYSHELTGSKNEPLSRVDLGAQIVTGFSGGNPLSTLLQRQLACPYHPLVHAKKNKIHGQDGGPIDTEQDVRVEGLFNLLLDSAARFRYFVEHTPQSDHLTSEDQLQDTTIPLPKTDYHVPVADKVLGVMKVNSPSVTTPIEKDPKIELRNLGYRIKSDDKMPIIPEALSLGETMTNILKAYVSVAEISQEDQQVLQWHWANMEYACGTSLDNLSLKHWDQDDGNEFSGHHAMIIGGYSQLARGLALSPSKLSIRTNCAVGRISKSGVLLQSGETLAASKVVVTLPLGVLKSGAVEFAPTLPEWKSSAISNLGYGLLNKVVLIFEEQFWESDIDLLGSVPPKREHDSNHDSRARGRFYMFWNCTSHASGRPVLIALMTGEAALACEQESPETLLAEALSILQAIYGEAKVLAPVDTIVTRWGQDPFSLGSYSYIGPHGSGSDYDALARPIDDTWFFAGEATCRTHPSTVHGAYLSGLAAAKEVIDSIIGRQRISPDIPLVPTKPKPSASQSAQPESKKRKFAATRESNDSTSDQQESLENIQKHRAERERDALDARILQNIGARPELPKRTNVNPFLIFQKDQWNTCRAMADGIQQRKQSNSAAQATKNQIRACLGQTWRDTSEAEKQPWIDIVNERRDAYETIKTEWAAKNTEWELACDKIIKDFDNEERPNFVSKEETEMIATIKSDSVPRVDVSIENESKISALSESPECSAR